MNISLGFVQSPFLYVFRYHTKENFLVSAHIKLVQYVFKILYIHRKGILSPYQFQQPQIHRHQLSNFREINELKNMTHA